MLVVVGQLPLDQLVFKLILRNNISTTPNLLHLAALEEVRELPKKVMVASTRI